MAEDGETNRSQYYPYEHKEERSSYDRAVSITKIRDNLLLDARNSFLIDPGRSDVVIIPIMAWYN